MTSLRESTRIAVCAVAVIALSLPLSPRVYPQVAGATL